MTLKELVEKLGKQTNEGMLSSIGGNLEYFSVETDLAGAVTGHDYMGVALVQLDDGLYAIPYDDMVLADGYEQLYLEDAFKLDRRGIVKVLDDILAKIYRASDWALRLSVLLEQEKE